ncbi:MAG: GAF domain-containing protein [Spirochaetes bacterium]|nr:GAF domain-containing protein [Spirochaetota bacterium]
MKRSNDKSAVIERLTGFLKERCGYDDAEAEIADILDAYRDQQALIDIGKSLMAERDTDKLLRLILMTSKGITGADAGSIFLVEKHDEGTFLRFAYSHTTSIDVNYEVFTMPANPSSIAGYVSLEGEILNIADAYEIDDSMPFRFNRSFDVNNGYRTKSMLVVPMLDHNESIVGVIQLINSKESVEFPAGDLAFSLILKAPADYEEKVVPFKKRYEDLMTAVANQAAMALENSRMIEEIKLMFEKFVNVSADTIESNDPSTRGHSERVARTAVALARAMSAETEGSYAMRSFTEPEYRELWYSGLLHDFGKMRISPEIFKKAKKLYPRDFDYLMLRIKYLRKALELGYERLMHEIDLAGDGPEAVKAREERAACVAELLEAAELIRILNEPTPTDRDICAEVSRLLGSSFPGFCVDDDGVPIPLLTETEARCISVPKGSLTDEERHIMQMHVDYTYEFVSAIPWPAELRNIPEYCWDHHELLNGSGYPRGLTANAIPLQARMLAICDVYDALSASDRPYKKALPFEKCKAILADEGRSGRLDAELVRIFIEREAYKG